MQQDSPVFCVGVCVLVFRCYEYSRTDGHVNASLFSVQHMSLGDLEDERRMKFLDIQRLIPNVYSLFSSLSLSWSCM